MSLITISEAQNHSGYRLRECHAPNLNEVQQWLATNDILDPANTDNIWSEIDV